MNRQGPQGQGVRAISGFGAQPGPQSRVAPLGSGRLQNPKAGNAPGWGFNAPNGSAPGLGAPQGRGPGGASSFAQTISGSQSSGPLDLSEFPSLSGGPQSNFQNQGQAAWNSQRPQQTPVGRPQASAINSHPSSQAVGSQSQDPVDETFGSFPSATNGSLEDYRHGGQGGVGQLSGSGQQQAGSSDDFPPLGRLGQDGRAAMMQNAAGGFSGGSPFATGQTGSKGSDGLRQDSGRQFSEGSSPPGLSVSDTSLSSTMSELDRYGLAGLLGVIRTQNTDAANLAIGQNLNTLGLDLDSSDPLHPTFAGPFASAPTRPLQPDFTLPACYNVANTHPVDEKLNGLSDETLLYIFYNLPRDVMQEQAAIELTERNWRFHKVLGLWLTKEANVPEPTLIAHEVERGRYIVFNNRTWQREGREMIIRYSDLDDHITRAQQGGAP